MLLAGQVELDNVPSSWGTITTTNGPLVAQTRTSNKRQRASTNAETSHVHIASIHVCWIRMEKPVVMFIAAVGVPQIQHRRGQCTAFHILFF
jgi:hypothetical protein